MKDPLKVPSKISFSLNPDCEEIVLLRNFDTKSDFDFLCYPEFESGQEIIIGYVKSIGTCKPRLDVEGEENGVCCWLGKDKEKFYYLVENESGWDYEEFVSFVTKNCELDGVDDDASAKNF